MSPRRYIFVIHARCGGTWVTQTIDSHPDAHVGGELLNRVRGPYEELAEVVDTFWAEDDCEAAKEVCAFRMTYHIFGTWEPLRYLQEHKDVSIVFVTRWNKFERAMSLATTRALDTGFAPGQPEHIKAFHCEEGEACEAHEVTVEMDATETVEIMARALKEDEELRGLLKESEDLRWREFIYEDIMAGGFNPLLGYMQLQPVADLHTSLVKRVVKRQSEVVSNYHEITRVIGATPYRWYLEYCLDHMGDAHDCTKLHPAPAESGHGRKKANGRGKGTGRGHGRGLSSIVHSPGELGEWTPEVKVVSQASMQIPAALLALFIVFLVALWKRRVLRGKRIAHACIKAEAGVRW